VDDNDNVWFTEWTANKIAVLNSHKQVPFNIILSERDISVERGGEKEISVMLQLNGSLDSPVTLYASGTTTGTGVTNGLSVSFEPAELSTQQRNSTLTLKVKSSLPPGVYTLMVGGRYNEVNRLDAVHLIVGSPNSILIFKHNLIFHREMGCAVLGVDAVFGGSYDDHVPTNQEKDSKLKKHHPRLGGPFDIYYSQRSS
jgi:hypothetical protein